MVLLRRANWRLGIETLGFFVKGLHRVCSVFGVKFCCVLLFTGVYILWMLAQDCLDCERAYLEWGVSDVSLSYNAKKVFYCYK